MGKSYDIVDFETRSNQFTERILTYSFDDGVYESTDFTSDKLVAIIGGDEASSETLSIQLQLEALDDYNGDELMPAYYARDTFEKQNPATTVNSVYIKKISTRYIYLSDLAQNAKLTVSYIYKS